MTRLTNKQLEACRILAEDEGVNGWYTIESGYVSDGVVNLRMAQKLRRRRLVEIKHGRSGSLSYWQVRLTPAAKQLIAMQPPNEGEK